MNKSKNGLKKVTVKKALKITPKSKTRKSKQKSEENMILKSECKEFIKQISASILKNKEIQQKVFESKKLNTKKVSNTDINNLKLSNINNKTMNTELMNIMDELGDIMTRKGEPFKARAYKKASETIMTYPSDIINVKQLEGNPGIGKTIMEKMEEYQKTGTLKILERERSDPMNLFTKIYGVGPKKAKVLIDDGITTIQDLKNHQDKLNDTQKIGLNYYEDLQKRIPRDEIEEYDKIFKNLFNEVAPPGSKYEIVGSYRRNAKTSGDIDIIITNNENNIDAFNKFLDKLIKENILVEVLTRGKVKSLTIGKLPSSIPRRLDFLYTPPDEYAFAILYFTGSKAFNTVMRQRALDLGYSLNEHGLTKMESGKKQEKVNILFPNEESIFKFLGMKYKEPSEREGYKSVELLPENEESTLNTNILQKEKPKKAKTLKKTLKSDSFNEHIKKLKEEGIDVLKMLNEKQLAKILDEASKAYYNEEPLMSDNEFDIVKEYMEQKYPKNKILKQIGAPIADKNKVTLPYNMPSMDKIKPDTNALSKWKLKYSGPYLVSAKLDGISALYSTENNEQKLYTRGNGTIGQDISHLIPYLKLPSTKDITIRGELIMKKTVFIEKYMKEFSNSRNLVAGVVNQKNVQSDKIEDVDFVAYEVIKPSLKPSEQMNYLKNENVKTVIHKLFDNIDNSILSNILITWREDYEYTIDGIIVNDDKIYPRTKKNPEHAFAFKMVLSDQIAEAKVLNVLWAASKDGYLKPRIQIEPVILGGAKIEYATAFNAAFVENNKLGIGAIVKLVRSGDVIPHIMDVIEPSEKAKMPDVPYKWNDTHVDIILIDADEDETVREKNIIGFFKNLEVVGLGEGNVKKIIKAGFESIPEIIAMTPNDFLKVDGFKQKMAEKVYNSIHEKINNASLSRLMTASNIFGRGFGEKKINLILENYPTILTDKDSEQDKINKLLSIKGIETKTAEKFVKNISKFKDFLVIAKLENKLMEIETEKQEKKDKSNILFDKSIVITGFRDKELSQKLKDIGAKESTSVSKNTFALIVKNKIAIEEDKSSKILKAEKLNIPIYTLDNFKEVFKL